jgi:uncharacterized protein (DUF1501 family)
MLCRRDFLRHSSLIALAPVVPGFLARTARAAEAKRDARVLVVIQLNGGNDGINTVVPFADEGYAKHRKALRLRREQLIKVNDRVGLHPALGDVAKLLEAGRLAVIQGVGYPNPSRSHFQSMAIWHTARFDIEDSPGEVLCNRFGWIGRALDSAKAARGTAGAVYVGAGTLPAAVRARHAMVSSLSDPKDFVLASEMKAKSPAPARGAREDLAAFVRRSALDAYATADRMAEVMRAGNGPARYPATQLAADLRLIARLIKANTGTRVFYACQPGYDTHSGQANTHYALLNELAGALKALHDDLGASGLADRVAVMAFSEFGRTVAENGSAGTDHGTAGPVFVVGPKLTGPLVGDTPNLTDLDPKHGDLRVGLDFRRAYATFLDDWLGLSAEAALGQKFERLSLFRS